ncbi:enoyl-CoA hydratase/isomerase family protein [Xanthobacter sp. DSM 24535]|uniref:enoyl-CoA hydratase/isomerase family protein n=1 Tax=Roseixanthobacter psychrophilus TaxID=3119917 RepID=UPI00372B275E
MAEPLLRVEQDGPVRHLILDRPGQRNALSRALIEDLLAALQDAAASPEVGAVVLRGEGAGFCAGADLKETAALVRESDVRGHAARLRLLLETLVTLAKPVVAQVHGFALGAGCALVLSCDAAFCAPGTRFGYPEARHNIVPALVAPGLVRLVGRRAAFDLLGTGRLLDADEACALGFARGVPQAQDLPDAVRAYASGLAGQAGDFVPAIKALLDEVEDAPFAVAMARAMEANVRSRMARVAAQTRLAAGEG